MKCPECGKELLPITQSKFGIVHKTIEFSPDHENYTCLNEDCSKYRKILVYDVKQEKWKS